jgi:succinoglycan biosynthesis transport protein ExoP
MSNIVPYSSSFPQRYDPPPASPARSRITLREIFGLLITRLWLGLIVAAVIFVAVMAVVSQMPREYYAESSVLIQPQRANLAEEPTQQLLPTDTSAVDTEVEVLRSPALAEAVAKKLQLYQDPEFNPMLETRNGQAVNPPSDEPEPAVMAAVTNTLQKHMNIRRVGLTYVAEIGVSSTSPRKAEEIANTYVDTYMERQLRSKIDAVERANDELGASVESLRTDAYETQAALQQYKVANGLMSAEGATMAEMEVSTLNTQIAAARAETAQRRAMLDAALDQMQQGGGGADVAAALSSPTVQELRQQEADTRRRLAELRVRFLPEYPDVKRAEAELVTIQENIQEEIDRVVSNLRAEAQAAQQRQSSLLSSRGQAAGGLAANGQAMIGLVALEQRADAAEKIYQSYLDKANEVAVAGSLQQPNATVNSRANRPTGPSSPNMGLMTAVAAFLGLLGASTSMLMAEMWDRRLRSRSDIERGINTPFAGVLPEFRSVSRGKLRGPAGPADHLVDHPFTGFAEAYRNLRAYLMTSLTNGPTKLIAVTSAVPREGKSMTSLCLARTMAMAGSKVAVVDCDLRQRGLSKLFGEIEKGLVEVVKGKVKLDDALFRDPKTGLWVLGASDTADIPHDLFNDPATDKLMRALGEQFDYVILDTPPVLGIADARIIAAKADRTLYTVQWNKTPLRAAVSAVEILRESGARIAGAVLSRVDARQQSRYGYGDSSDYFQYFRSYYLAAPGR